MFEKSYKILSRSLKNKKMDKILQTLKKKIQVSLLSKTHLQFTKFPKKTTTTTSQMKTMKIKTA